MKLFRYWVITGLFLFSHIAAEFHTEFNIDLVKTPTVKSTYFSFPGANSQHVYDGIILDMFRWQIRTDDPSRVHWSLRDTVWTQVEGTSTVSPISQFYEFSLHAMKDDRYFLDFIPWKSMPDGGIAYLSKGRIELSIKPEDGDIMSGPGIKPTILPPALNRSATDSLQYLILTNQTLLPAAEAIVTLYSEEIAPEYRLNAGIALMDTLTQTVREFLLQSIINAPQLQYVLFLGDETVIQPMYIFTYDPTIPGLIQRPSDDFFTSLPEYSSYPQVTTGRVPVHQLPQAVSFVEKLRSYLLSPVQGNWREKLVLLADDTNKINSNISTEISHVENSDEIYQMLDHLLEIQPIYGTEFQAIPGDGWLLQPDMTEMALQSINDGIAMINYIGHGSPTTLADEKIILMNRDIASIHDPTGAIWVVGTCSFGWYDDEDCMTEELLARSDGSIGVISTTYKVNVYSNSNYLMRLFDHVRGFINSENSFRLGDLVRYSKAGGQDYWFHTFGDPAMPLPFPKKENVIDTVYTSPAFGILQPFMLQLTSGYGFLYGYADIRGEPSHVTRLYESGTIELTYVLPGEVIYQGIFDSDLTFIVPLDITACDTCTGTLRVYSENGGIHTDFLDHIPILPFTGSLVDTVGPQIMIYQNDHFITDQGAIFPPYHLQLRFTDDSGINLTGSTGHSLLYQIDEKSFVEFTHHYTSVSPTEGFFNLDLSDEPIGSHTMRVEVWDNANNRSENLYTLYFSDTGSFGVELIYNYPNPFAEDTYFTFHLSQPAEVSIRIFTSDGQTLITLKTNSLSSGYHSVYWNGKDSHGLSPANGTYFYQLIANADNGKKFESLHKMTRLK